MSIFDSMDFFTAILGEAGAQALQKAAQRDPALAGVLGPRAVVGWLASLDGPYTGDVPGVNVSMALSKNDDLCSGHVGNYSFEGVSLNHVAAAVCYALDMTLTPGSDLRDLTLVRLGKSLDALILAKKSLDPSAGYAITHIHHDLGDGQMLTQLTVHHGGQVVGGALLTHRDGGLYPDDINVHPDHRRLGVASAMYAHVERVTGKKVMPSMSQEAPGKALWAGNALKPQFGSATIGKSEALLPCPVCGGVQFASDKFCGCECNRELCKNSKTLEYGDGYVVEFTGVDPEAVKALRLRWA